MLPSSEVTATTRESTQSLAAAFACFTEAADSLERSYGNLQNEVAALRLQLDCAHQQLATERENVRRAQSLAEVATLLAHEIRNPLGSLELFSGLLAEDTALSADGRKFVAHIQAGLRGLSATVNNVLQFHSLDPTRLVPTNLSNLIRMTLEFLAPVAAQSGVELDFKDGLGELCIGADPHRLQQVLLNLAMNSIRFMPTGGSFQVTGAVANGNVELRIKDSGPGIVPAIRRRIFEAGFTTRPGSPGLGLAVCKKVVEQHGGTIEVADSQEGAEFVLRFRV